MSKLMTGFVVVAGTLAAVGGLITTIAFVKALRAAKK